MILNSWKVKSTWHFNCKIPKGIKKGRHKMAIDLNLIPYYGKADDKD